MTACSPAITRRPHPNRKSLWSSSQRTLVCASSATEVRGAYERVIEGLTNMKNLCACNCGTHITPKNNQGKRGGMKFAPGHNQFRSESTESCGLQIHRARKGRRPPAAKIYQ